MYELDIKKQVIKIEGKVFDPNFFRQQSDELFLEKAPSSFHTDLYLFLKEWFSDKLTVTVKTSGSTGIPKEMQVEKSRMMQSAILTCTFLKLKPNDTALLCMPMQYIAGKMVVVRSLVCGLDLYPIEPSGNPFKKLDISFDFAALVPLQVFNTIKEPLQLERLQRVKNLIIGGGAIDPQVEEAIRYFPHNVYSTYGMTETLSHIALRKLNLHNASSTYIPFDSVSLSLSEKGTLIIDAPLVSNERIYTNDVVEILSDGSFCILGRIDNIINTGGIKVQVEEVERKIKEYLDIPFAISSLPDPKFGEILVIVSNQNINLTLLDGLTPSYYIPKRCIFVEKLPFTETSKIDRPRLRDMITS